MNVAFLDQLRAATHDASRLIDQLASDTGMISELTVCCAPLAELVERWAEPTLDGSYAATCRHVTVQPAVLFAAVGRPGHVVCSRCVPDLSSHGLENHRCDLCQRVVTTIHNGVLPIGPVVLTYGICRRCVRRLDDCARVDVTREAA